MKKILTLIVLVFVFFGCAKKEISTQITTSNPVFFDQKPQNKSVFLDIKNSSSLPGDISALIAKNLYQKGYKISEEKLASSVIKGDFNYFDSPKNSDKNIFMNFGFGFGSGGRSSSGVGLGMIFGDQNQNENFIYAQMALNIVVKGKKTQTRSTILNLKTNETDETKVAEIFAEKIAQKIDTFLNF